METLQNELETVTLGIYMASIDIKDAFNSIPDFSYRRIFESCMYGKWIWTSHANICKYFENTILKKFSYLQFKLMTYISKATVMRIASLML